MANITLEDVRAAVAELEAQGVTPSVTKLRAHLGRGSSSTITAHWRAIREQAEAEVGADPLPPELDPHAPPAALMDMLTAGAVRAGQEVYRRLSQDINDKINAARAKLDADRAEAQEAFDQVMADAGEARERAEAAEAKLQNTAVQLAVADEARAASVKALEQAQRDIEELRARLADSEHAKTTAEATLNAERQAHAQALEGLHEQLTLMTAERDAIKQENARLTDSVASHQEHAGVLRSEVASLRTRLDAADALNTRQQLAIDTARSEAAELRGRLAALADKKPTKKAGGSKDTKPPATAGKAKRTKS